MSSKWPTKILGELVLHKKGFAFKSKDYVETGTPVIRVSNFTEDGISQSDLKFVSTEIAKENSSVCLKAFDIVVATVGSWPNNPASVVGRTISVPAWADKALMNQNSVILRSTSNALIDQRFIYYQMKSTEFANHVISKAQGSANQASITLDAIFSFKLFWPKENIRRSIVEVLAALDERIALLRETNATLEAIAQALFKSWFVDFDPVRAKQQGQIPEGMDEATAALFPDSFEKSACGSLPKGWHNGTIEECCARIESGGTPKRTVPEYWLADIPWLTSGEVRSPIVFDTKEKISELGVKDSSAKIWPAGTTVVAMYGATAGEVCLLANPMTANQACCGLIPRNEFRSFLFFAVRRERQNLAAKSTGSAQQNLNKGLVSQHQILVPNDEIVASYENIIGLLLNRWMANEQAAQTLAAIRDTLLPRLISGQLRIPEAKQAVEEAAA